MNHLPDTYRMTTLGCRANHAEEREMEAVLHARGFRPAQQNEVARLEVVHTCSVTARAAAKSRQAIRRSARPLPDQAIKPKVMVTGCFVGTDPTTASRLASDNGTDPGTVVGHADKNGLTMIERFALEIDRWLGSDLTNPPHRASEQIHSLPIFTLPTRPARHARAEIRIQDGCDAHCTFCIIPTLRPTLRSKTLANVVDEAHRLVDLGHQEIVLTGIFIGAYGQSTALRRRQDPAPATRLSDLVGAVAAVNGVKRVRISSMEPMDVTQDLIDAMVANRHVVVPHLHLPLQSGSDNILRRMNRQYRVGDYMDMIEHVKSSLVVDGLPPAITTDIICGFPGETASDFQSTIQVARQVSYLHMHVFPFSPRTGTAAARWRDRFVPASEVRNRVQTLINLENEPVNGLAVRFRKQLVGRQLRAIVEQPDRSRPGRWMGRCDHYERLSMAGPASRGQLVHAKVESLDGSDTLATIMNQAFSLPMMSSKARTLETCR